MKIVLASEDRDLLDLLGFVVGRDAFQPELIRDCRALLTTMDNSRYKDSEEMPAAAVLDPGGAVDGMVALLQTLRLNSAVPIIVLLPKQAPEADRVAVLEAGADDCVEKPVAHRELVARLRALIRRSGGGWRSLPPRVSRLEKKGLMVDPSQQAATKDGEPVPLTDLELRLLHYLMVNSGRVVTNEELLLQIWGFNDSSGIDAQRMAIYRLRRKIGDPAENPRYLVRRRGGIMFNEE